MVGGSPDWPALRANLTRAAVKLNEQLDVLKVRPGDVGGATSLTRSRKGTSLARSRRGHYTYSGTRTMRRFG